MSIPKLATRYGPWAVVTGASSGIGFANRAELQQVMAGMVPAGHAAAHGK